MSTVTVIRATGPSGKTKVYSSQRAASRELSGDGSDNRRRTIVTKATNGGGYIGSVWLTSTVR